MAIKFEILKNFFSFLFSYFNPFPSCRSIKNPDSRDESSKKPPADVLKWEASKAKRRTLWHSLDHLSSQSRKEEFIDTTLRGKFQCHKHPHYTLNWNLVDDYRGTTDLNNFVDHIIKYQVLGEQFGKPFVSHLMFQAIVLIS